jgi:hypothetical protein
MIDIQDPFCAIDFDVKSLVVNLQVFDAIHLNHTSFIEDGSVDPACCLPKAFTHLGGTSARNKLERERERERERARERERG